MSCYISSNNNRVYVAPEASYGQAAGITGSNRIPIVTLMGSVLVALVSGSVLFESTFSWPGIGRMAVQAAFQRDYPVLMGNLVIVATLTAVGQGEMRAAARSVSTQASNCGWVSGCL